MVGPSNVVGEISKINWVSVILALLLLDLKLVMCLSIVPDGL